MVNRRGNRWVLQRTAAEPIPEGLIDPSFDGPNVKDSARLTSIVNHILERGGMKGERRWSIALPRHSARVMILQIDDLPAKRTELTQMLEFKLERMLEIPSTDLTISFQRLDTATHGVRFLVAAVRNEVLAAYEEVVRSSGLLPGLVVPGQLAEAAWLLVSQAQQDSLLLSSEGPELLVVFARGGRLLSMREVEFSPDGPADELHRTLVYYLDKLATPDSKLDLILLSDERLNTGQVGSICDELFPPDARPRVESLADQQLEGYEASQFRHISSAVALAALATA